MGLSLASRLVDLHGGGLQVMTAEPTGTRMQVSLALQPDAAVEALQQQSAAVHRSCKILVVDDHAQSRALLVSYLNHHGHDVVLASDGLEAVQQAHEHQPHLILMDVRLPVLDGIEATRRIRELPQHQTTPILAVTALALPGDRERCLEAGVTDYLTKPFRLQAIGAFVAAHCPEQA
jgi:CheY-like chemotaxis protein